MVEPQEKGSFLPTDYVDIKKEPSQQLSSNILNGAGVVVIYNFFSLYNDLIYKNINHYTYYNTYS